MKEKQKRKEKTREKKDKKIGIKKLEKCLEIQKGKRM